MKVKSFFVSLLLFAGLIHCAWAEVTMQLTDNGDGTLTAIFYSKGKEVAKQLQKRDGSVLNTTGKIPDGIVKEYYGKGKLKSECNYKDNKLDGISKWYYEDGTLRAEKQYRADVLDGVTRYYYPSGAISGEYHYKNGKIEGKNILYWGNGKVKSEDYYKGGMLDGQCKRFYETGELRFVDTYRNGERIERKTYTRGGTLIDVQKAETKDKKQ